MTQNQQEQGKSTAMLCKEHNENCESFCEDPKCFKLICSKCSLLSHKSHPQKSISSATSHYRQILTQKVAKVTNLFEKIEIDVSSLVHSLQKLELEKIQAKVRLKESMDRLRDLINHREAVLLDDINMEAFKISSRLEEKRQQLSYFAQNTTKSLETVQKHLSQSEKETNNPSPPSSCLILENVKADLDILSKIVTPRVHDLQSLLSSPNSTGKDAPIFVEYQETKGVDFKNSIESFGVILSHQKIEPPQPREFSSLQIPHHIYGPDLGNNLDQLYYPRFITKIPSGWFYTNKDSSHKIHDDILVISDTENNRIVLLEKTTGRVNLVIGGQKKGTEPGQLSYPKGLVAIRCNTPPFIRIVVADGENNRIQLFDAENGRYLHHFTHDLIKDPVGVAVIPSSGYIVVVNFNSNTITIHKGYGSLTKSSHPSSSKNDKTESKNFKRITEGESKSFSSGGQLIKVIQLSPEIQFNSPRGVAVNSKNQLIVSSIHKIDVFDSEENDWKHLKSFGREGSNNGEFFYPDGVSVDAFDNIFVSDTCNHRVQIFSSDFQWINTFGKKGHDVGNFCNPAGLYVDNISGDILVVDYSNHRIVMV